MNPMYKTNRAVCPYCNVVVRNLNRHFIRSRCADQHKKLDTLGKFKKLH